MSGPGGAAPAFAESPAGQPTPQSGIRLGSNGPGPAPGGGPADVSALIMDALGPGGRPDSATGGFPAPGPSDLQGFGGPQGYPGPQGMGPQGMGPQGYGAQGGPQGFGGGQGQGFGGPGGFSPHAPQPGYDPNHGYGTPSQGGFPGQQGGYDGGVGEGGFPPAASSGAQIPAHLLTNHNQAAPERGSMRTWYVVCLLAMVLVAAVTFIALRYMSAG